MTNSSKIKSLVAVWKSTGLVDGKKYATYPKAFGAILKWIADNDSSSKSTPFKAKAKAPKKAATSKKKK